MDSLTYAKINDFRPEVRSLLNRLIKAGAILTQADDGVEEEAHDVDHDDLDSAVDVLTSVDESVLHGVLGAKGFWLQLVLGNEPGELVSNYTLDPTIEAVVDAHASAWETKGQPKCFLVSGTHETKGWVYRKVKTRAAAEALIAELRGAE